MLCVSGPTLDTKTTGFDRAPFIVTGVAYSPKVFAVTMETWLDKDLRTARVWPLPFRLAISIATSRVSPRFRSVEHKTSDELPLQLVNTFQWMDLWNLTYNVVDDGMLLTSEVVDATCVGRL